MKGFGCTPEQWRVVKLKTATRFLYGRALSNQNRCEGKIPVYGSNGITGYHHQALTNAPCIIIGRKGSIGQIHYSDVPCFPIDSAYYINAQATDNHIRWLYYALQALDLGSISKDPTLPWLRREEAFDQSILLPPPKEQQVIADYLDVKVGLIDGLIAQKTRQIELWKEQQQGLIHQAISKGLDPDVVLKDSGIEWLGSIPQHWEIRKLKFCVDSVLTGGTPPTSEKRYFENGDIDWFTSGDFDEGIHLTRSKRKISHLAVKDEKVHCHKKMTVFVVGTGTTLGRVGISKIPCSSNQQLHAITFRDDYNPYFGAYYLKSISDIMTSISNFSASPMINQSKIKDIMLTVPPGNEQDDIINHIFEVERQTRNVIDKAEQQIHLLQEYRTALISEAVTGKIDVREWGN